MMAKNEQAALHLASVRMCCCNSGVEPGMRGHFANNGDLPETSEARHKIVPCALSPGLPRPTLGRMLEKVENV